MSYESYILGTNALSAHALHGKSESTGYEILGNSFHRTEIVGARSGKGHMPARIRGYEAEIFGEEIGNSFNNTEIVGDTLSYTEIVGDAAWQAAIFGDQAEIFGYQAEIFGGGDYRDASTVRAVQSELRDRGYKNKSDGKPLSVDGVYGPNTAAAIKNVQLQTGGAQSGVIDDSLLLTLGLPLPAQQAMPAIPAIPNIPNMPAIPNIPGLTTNMPDPLARMLPPGEKPAEPSFLDKPISTGSNVKVYQAGLGVIGLGLLAAGLYAATRR